MQAILTTMVRAGSILDVSGVIIFVLCVFFFNEVDNPRANNFVLRDSSVNVLS